MAKILTSVCDKHLAEGVWAEPTEQVPFELDGESFLLDLCAEHYKTWFLPIKEELASLIAANMADENGQIPVTEFAAGAGASIGESEPKPITLNGCEFCNHAPFKATVGMISHMRTAHPDEYPAWKKRWDIAKADG